MNIERASDFSIRNMDEMKKATFAGCYFCLKIFSISIIKNTCDGGKTALCPHCGIDSVLSDLSPYKIDKETLSKLKRYWF